MPDQREGLRESVAPFVGIRFAGEADVGEVPVSPLEEVLGGEVTKFVSPSVEQRLAEKVRTLTPP